MIMLIRYRVHTINLTKDAHEGSKALYTWLGGLVRMITTIIRTCSGLLPRLVVYRQPNKYRRPGRRRKETFKNV